MNAKERIIVSSYLISTDNKIFNRLIQKLNNECEVIILTRPKVKNMEALIELKKAGAIIFGHDDIHAKIIFTKSGNLKSGILMTANIQKISFNNSFESGVLLSNNETQDIIQIIKDKDADLPVLIGGPHCTLYPKKTLRDLSADICVQGDGEQIILKIGNALSNQKELNEI